MRLSSRGSKGRSPKQQTTNNKQQTTNNKQQTTNNKQQTTNTKQQTFFPLLQKIEVCPSNFI